MLGCKSLIDSSRIGKVSAAKCDDRPAREQEQHGSSPHSVTDKGQAPVLNGVVHTNAANLYIG
jgi:hypothetical protein